MIWPIKTGVTFFDYWTLSHLFFWFVVGSSTAGMNRFRLVFPVSLVVAYAWEGFERFAERRWTGIWLSPESFLNSWVSDPLMCVVGLLIAWYGFDHWRP